MELPQPDWSQILNHLIHLSIAYVLAFPIGWNREVRVRNAGLRTFPLVAIGSCGFMLLGLEGLDSTEAEARVLYGLMTGIGFLGGGAILKGKDHVRGTATAASIWITGAVGGAVAFGRYEIAVVLSVLNWLTLSWFQPVKERIHEESAEGSSAQTNVTDEEPE